MIIPMYKNFTKKVHSGTHIAFFVFCLASVCVIFSGCNSHNAVSIQDWAESIGLKIIVTKDSTVYKNNLHAEGIDSDAVVSLLTDIESGKWVNVHGLLIIKDGCVIAEEYWNGSHASKLHDIRSASKSIASILTGIAAEKGFISSAQEKVYDFYPEYEPSFPLHLSQEQALLWKNSLTIEHLLNMTSGYEYDDWNENFRGEMEIAKSRNWLKFAAESEISKRPGTFYAYNTASLVLLSGIISQSSQMPMTEFAQKELFTPLGIDRWKWFSRGGVVYMGGNLWLTLRDMAKIGLLMLNDGVWKGQRLVPHEWIMEAEKELTADEPSWKKHGFYHHYLWWQFDENIDGKRIRAFYASGNGGQTIMFIPDLNMVIAMTTGNYNTPLEGQSVEIIREIVIPATLYPVQ